LAINSTSGGAATVQITSWAYAEASAATQAQANGTDEVVFADAINGTGTGGNLMASPVYSGRIVVKNRGLGDEEVRYIVSVTAGTGTTDIATVSEPWDVAPVATDSLEVSYIVQDAATVNGVGLVNKTNDDYDFSKAFEVQSGGGFALLNGATMITDTNGLTTKGEIHCASGGWFQVGVLQFGRGVRGGRITLSAGTGPADGDWGIEIVSGGIGNFYGLDCKGGVSYRNQMLGTCDSVDSKFFNCFYNGDISGIVHMESTVIEGTGLTTDQLTCDASTDIQSLVYGNADGFTDNAAAGVETITLKDVDWSGLLLHIEVQHADKTFIVLDGFNFEPVITDQTELLFTAAGDVDQRNSFAAAVLEPDGTARNGAKVYVTEHTIGDIVDQELTTDSNGDASADILYRTFRDNTTTVTRVTYGAWAVKVYDYGFLPVVASLDFSARAVENQFSALTDPDVTAASGAAAITAGAGIIAVRHGTGETDTRPMKVMRIDGVVTAPVVGDVIDDNVGGTKSGTVIDVVSRGSGVYDVVLQLWSGVEFADNDVLDLNAAAWDAGAVLADTAGFYSEVTWWLGELAAGNTTTVLYDYQVGRMEEATATTEWKDVIEAMEGEHAVPMQGNGSKAFTTIRNVARTEGWWAGRVTDLGNLTSCTMDDGTTWSPPATVNVTFHSIATGSSIKIIATAGGDLPAGTVIKNEVVTTDPYTFSFNIGASDQPIGYKIRKGSASPRYVPIPNTSSTDGVLVTIDKDTGFTVTIQQISDE
jgi:hypothetical protein